MVLVLLSFPFLLRQIVQSLPEGTRKTGWLVKLCFQIVGVPNCIPPDRCNAKHKQGKSKERERENKKEQERMQKKIGSIQNKSTATTNKWLLPVHEFTNLLFATHKYY